MPTPMNVVINRSRGFASSSRCRHPMWSKSVCVSQIHLRSAGSITDCRAVMNSSLSTTAPVSTRIGSSPLMTKAFTGTIPKPGIGMSDVITSISGAASYVFTISRPFVRSARS